MNMICRNKTEGMTIIGKIMTEEQGTWWTWEWEQTLCREEWTLETLKQTIVKEQEWWKIFIWKLMKECARLWISMNSWLIIFASSVYRGLNECVNISTWKSVQRKERYTNDILIFTTKFFLPLVAQEWISYQRNGKDTQHMILMTV